jgi:hypothetical protein
MAGVIYKVKSFEDLKNNMDIFEISKVRNNDFQSFIDNSHDKKLN